MILSAGAVGSPHLLQLSGVGDPEHLGKIGVPVVHELRGVGRTCRTITSCASPIRSSACATANEKSRGLPLAGEVMRWLVHRQGHADLQPLAGRRLGQGAGGIRRPPTCRCTFAPGSFKGGQIGELEETPGLSAGAWQMRPLSRGYVEAKIEPARRHAGDQPALPVGGDRPARDHRRPALCPAALRRAGAEAVSSGDESLPGSAGAERRRAARLRAAQRQHRAITPAAPA